MHVNGTELVEGLVMLKSKYSRSVALVALLASTSISPLAAQETPAIGEAVTTDGTMAPNAGIEQINQALEALTAELMQSLSPKGTYAVKSANDTTSGVPKDLLTQMTSSLQSSLMLASDFQVTLIDQAQLQTAWSNAVEFNGADFEKLVENANFDALVILHSRATEIGIEISLQAVSTEPSTSGVTIAATSSKNISINWESVAGIDVNLIKSQYEKVLAEIEALQKDGTDISFATADTFSEKYVLAKRLAQAGDNTNAINLLVECVEENTQFADPAIMLSNLLLFQFGDEGRRKYIDKKLNSLPVGQLKLIQAMGDANIYSNHEVIELGFDSPALHVITLGKILSGPFQESKARLSSSSLGVMADETRRPILSDLVVTFVGWDLARRIDRAQSAGELKYYFLEADTPRNLLGDESKIASALQPPEWVDFVAVQRIRDATYSTSITEGDLSKLIDASATDALALAQNGWTTTNSNNLTYFDEAIWYNSLSGTISSALLAAYFVDSSKAKAILDEALPLYMGRKPSMFAAGSFSHPPEYNDGCTQSVSLTEFAVAYEKIGYTEQAIQLRKSANSGCETHLHSVASDFPDLTSLNMVYSGRGPKAVDAFQTLLAESTETNGGRYMEEIKSLPDYMRHGRYADGIAFVKPKLFSSLAVATAEQSNGNAKTLAIESILLSAQNRFSYESILVENAAIYAAATLHGLTAKKMTTKQVDLNVSQGPKSHIEPDSDVLTPFSTANPVPFPSNWRQEICRWGLLENPIVEEVYDDANGPLRTIRYKFKAGETFGNESSCQEGYFPDGISWEAPIEIRAYCGFNAPAIDFDLSTNDAIPIIPVNGPPGYMIAASNVYLHACHGNQTLAGFNQDAEGLGYVDILDDSFEDFSGLVHLLERKFQSNPESHRSAPSVEAFAPSFNCAKAQFADEIAICDSDALALLDQEFTAEFLAAKNRVGVDAAKGVARNYILSRKSCGADKECITTIYREGISELKRLPVTQEEILVPSDLDQTALVQQAFKELPDGDRRAVQESLQAYGYYSGSIDGAWGPATEHAIVKFFDVLDENGISYSLSSPSALVDLMSLVKAPEYAAFFPAASPLTKKISLEGSYDSNGSCSAQSDSHLNVTPTAFEFYEAYCQISSASDLGGGRQSIELSCSGEGEEWQFTISAFKDGAGDLFLGEGEDQVRYYSCP